MSRILSAIQIIAVLASQTLASLAHTHSGTCGGLADEENRPHVHLHFGRHHHYADGPHARSHLPTDGSGESPAGLLPGHDEDTFYVSTNVVLTKLPSASQFPQLVWQSGLSHVSHTSNADGQCNSLPIADTPSRPKCARFLQLLSIRC
jgi:hypothetical protein